MWGLLPTLADIAGGDIPRGVQGRSLWPVVTGADYPDAEFDRSTLSAVTAASPTPRPTPTTSNRQVALAHVKQGVRKGDWKLVHDTAGRHSFEFYNVAEDPEELRDVADQHPETDADLKDELLWWTGRLDALEQLDDPIAKRTPHSWWDHPEWTSNK